MHYQSLDAEDPVGFDGTSVTYGDTSFVLGPHAFFIDGQLTAEETKCSPYVFNSINEATKHLSDGTRDEPMVLYLAPYVYWVDDPDDPAVKVPAPGNNVPFGLEIKCEWLRFYGLTKNPRNVVVASNRGQTMGAKGNFTMLRISGDGTSSENLTFGNFCNIDLEYPLNAVLNKPKRGSAIVQAQLVFCDGDQLVARNTHFISRLNLCPFVGGKRTLFDQCYFESTDDALTPNGVYLNCTFRFYSSKPFYSTLGTGAVFLNCDIQSFTRGEQYLMKSSGQMAIIDSRMISETVNYWGWIANPMPENRFYQYHNRFNGQPVFIGHQHSLSTVDLTGKEALNAYRFIYNNQVVYNTYNLLQGNDDWDPMGIKELVYRAEKEYEKCYTQVPVQLVVSPTRITLETGKDSAKIDARLLRFGNYEASKEDVSWHLAEQDAAFLTLQLREDGSCLLIPNNQQDIAKEMLVHASSSLGLTATCVVQVLPSILEPPGFIQLPVIKKRKDGFLNVEYQLDSSYDDQSVIHWYRCSDGNGTNPIEVAVSRFNVPLKMYQLMPGDEGFYLMASVSPKHLRSHTGSPVNVVFKKRILRKDISGDRNQYSVNLESFSTKYQPLLIPGFWSVDSYAPEDTREYNWKADNSRDAWYYGSGVNGAANDSGLVQAVKGARLRYTPVEEVSGDMKICFTACPAKTAGQGFSSARAQYMDIGIQFDTESLNGYALRLIRTTKYSDAIDCVFVKYTSGKVEEISDHVSTSCYRTECFITVETRGDQLIATAHTSADYQDSLNRPEVLPEVIMETKITPYPYSGIAIQHTGSVGDGATLIKDLVIEWF